MRDIKFRAYNKVSKKINYQDEMGYIDGCYLGSNGANQTTSNIYSASKRDSCVVMQFTGLKDKNGIEIYEGDLIRNRSGRVCSVVFNSNGAMFDAECHKKSWEGTNSVGFKTFQWSRCVEVIGNIHQDPELIKQAKQGV